MTTTRSPHWTDAPHPSGKGRRRVISNWCNYHSQGEWRASAPGASQAQGAPPEWVGAFDFSHASTQAPLQCFFRDAMDVGNRAMVGVRLSDRSGAWLNLKALDCSSADAVIEDGGASVRWPSLWPQTDLVFKPGRHKLAKELVLHAPGHPLAFEFSLRLAPGHVLAFADGGARVLDSDGAEVLRLPPPWAHDSATTGPGLDGHQSVGVTMTEGIERRIGGVAYRTIRLDLDGDDLASAVYPVVVDPTVQISGQAAVEDGYIYQGSAANYGGQAWQFVGRFTSGGVNRVIARPLAGHIPAGRITRLVYSMWRFSYSSSTEAGAMVAHAITAANTWAEGTAAGTAQEGSVSWAQRAYSATDPVYWVGAAGCSTSGVDYESDANPPSADFPAYTSGGGYRTAIELRPEWAIEWRSGARANNGFTLRATNEATPGALLACHTSEYSPPSYYEVDYYLPAAYYGRVSRQRRA
jgi:hypothetical protein